MGITTIDFLSYLRSLDIELYAEADKLRCRAPAGVLKPALRLEISHRKEEILDFLKAATPLPVIQPNPSEQYLPFPLTDIQQAYWLGRSDVFAMGNIATHVYLELDSQNLDVSRLNRAWQKLIERHDMLRAIVLSDGQQRILSEVPTYQIKSEDLRGKSSEVIALGLKAMRAEMSHQILPTESWPLFDIRATLLNDGWVRLHVSFDVLIADGWSLLLLFQEWQHLYQHPESTQRNLSLLFRDYVLAEKELERSELYQRSRKYWFSRLDSLPKAPDLPLAQNPSAIGQPHFERRSGHLERADWQRLKQRATQASITPSGVLLAAFAEILTVWSKTPRFTINLTMFNRLPMHPEVNQIVGDFTSLTLLEVNNSVGGTFIDRAVKIQKQLWQDLDHRYVSGVQILRELTRRQGGQTASMPVVFTSALALGSLQGDTKGLAEFGEMVYSISQTPQVWLDHQVLEQDGTLIFNWDALEDLFPSGLLDEMFGSYCEFLRQLANDEQLWLSPQRQLVPAAQLAQRKAINNTIAPIPAVTLHQLFLDRVARSPAAIAVITSEQQFTYAELSRRAHLLACKLRQLGAAPNQLVAVLMTKGWEQVVAVLAILISGAAYLPIAADLPQERQDYLLAQGEVKLGLTQSGRGNRGSQIHWLCVDTLFQGEAKTDEILFPTPYSALPTDLAYVIF
ncbi:MAG TPA: non-ribosomal peptide synthetase, partial [Cyanobacteria bacterium UBA8803]|nr:non-ribosomal peptide synthetase [Cyanobacteria bacterium UBA9273]HBL57454.1 non-ribosomal peptide synthetase [Cyanobacteria bacterium UBA8803]